jgi:hypothetical protein
MNRDGDDDGPFAALLRTQHGRSPECD